MHSMVSAEVQLDHATGMKGSIENWEIVLSLGEVLHDLGKKLKILVANYQIICYAPYIFTVHFPTGFTKFVDGLSFVNLDMFSLMPLQCDQDYDFVSNLLITTIAPLLCTVLFLVLAVGEYFIGYYSVIKEHRYDSPAAKEGRNKVKDKYINYFFYLTYLILPVVTTTIFQMFVAQKVDDTYYLKVDMSISCDSQYYKHWRGYAIVMIFVYPVGIPLMYFLVLYECRQEIQDRDKPPEKTPAAESIDSDTEHSPLSIVKASEPGNFDEPIEQNRDETEQWETQSVDTMVVVNEQVALGKDRDKGTDKKEERKEDKENNEGNGEEEEKRVLSPKAARLYFLYETYEPKFWYWEVVETSRRILLTAVISVTLPGDPSQVL